MNWTEWLVRFVFFTSGCAAGSGAALWVINKHAPVKNSVSHSWSQFDVKYTTDDRPWRPGKVL